MLGLQPLPTNATAFYYSSATKHKICTFQNQYSLVPDLRIISRFSMSVAAYKSDHFTDGEARVIIKLNNKIMRVHY